MIGHYKWCMLKLIYKIDEVAVPQSSSSSHGNCPKIEIAPPAVLEHSFVTQWYNNAKCMHLLMEYLLALLWQCECVTTTDSMPRLHTLCPAHGSWKSYVDELVTFPRWFHLFIILKYFISLLKVITQQHFLYVVNLKIIIRKAVGHLFTGHLFRKEMSYVTFYWAVLQVPGISLTWCTIVIGFHG